MAVDMLRARGKVGYGDPLLLAELDTETVASYCDRVLDAETRDHLFDPVLGGIFVVEGKNLSMADLWFTLWKVLLGGLLGYRGGIDVFARTLVEHLDVRTRATVTSVSRAGEGARVRWVDADGQHDEEVDGVVLTVPAPDVPQIFPQLDPALKTILLDGLQQANLVSIRLGLSQRPATNTVLIVAGRD
jgi:protoporphyrinogen oxidase